jgi:hypothetical protein
VHGLGLRQRLGQVDRLRLGAGHLDVGGVAGRQRDLVLARRAGRHVLVGARAAHHPDVGLDAVPLQPGALEDPVVGAGVDLVVGLQPGVVAIERVGVLHDELAGAQDAGARPRLVALLDLEVVEAERQVAIGAHDLRDVRRHALLVRHREDHLGALAVLELEQLVDVVAAGAVPGVGRLQDRHEHLLSTYGVDLLADDLHDLLVHAPARGQPGPQPRAELADESGAHHELVRDRLGIGRRLALGRQQQCGESGHEFTIR